MTCFKKPLKVKVGSLDHSCVACKNAILRHTIFVALPLSPNFIAYLLFAFLIYKYTHTHVWHAISTYIPFMFKRTPGNYSTNLGTFNVNTCYLIA